ncbi:hypothetical protein OHS59_25985 [Streptomyces sp. NBC_00414]|uniref:hypothetical protein n=1 Tax=Streptomyces sp. NBC_00414 TaxID=2975739 RepID=UPI002E2349C4
MRIPASSRLLIAGATAVAVLWSGGTAYADLDGNRASSPSPDASGGAKGKGLSAAVSRIRVTQVSGPTGGNRGSLSSTDVNWTPPPCWYEPVLTPDQLKALAETNGLGYVSPHTSWGGEKLWTDHYRDGKDAYNFKDGSLDTAKGYEDYNTGKNGYFWRGVAPDTADPASWDCERVMFWQNAGAVPAVPNAPTAKTLAEYAYDKVEVPGTEIELKPEGRSTVNAPTWVWLDKGTFQEVTVRAELPNTNLWAQTTAKPVALHLEPGTGDAETFPASGDCEIDDDGSIGTPYRTGDAGGTPPCGISYVRATAGDPYELNASVTWQITWEGTGGAGGTLPNGTFETTRPMSVQEIQSVNR